MNCLSRFTIPYAAFVFAISLCISPSVSAQVPPVKLDSIAAISSGGAPHVNFTFDSDITSYTVSTYKITTISNGQPTTSDPTPFIPSQQTPKSLSVPLDFQSFATNHDESVSISVTLGNGTNPSIVTTPSYFLDLSFLVAIQKYQSDITNLTQGQQAVQASLDVCKANLGTALQHINASSLNYKSAALVGATSVILYLTTDVYSQIRVTEPVTNQTKTSTGTDHYVKFTGLSPSTSYTFTAVALNATTNQPIPGLSQQITQSTSSNVVFSPTFASPGLSASGPTGLVASINFDPNHTLPSNFRSYIRLYYQAELSDGSFGPKTPFGDGGLDVNGIPQGTAYTSPYLAPQSFPVAVPTANTRYLVTFVAYDQYGDEVEYGSPGKQVQTPAVSAPLAFNGPITLAMNTSTGLTVSWTANGKVKNSILQIKFADGTYLPDVPTPTTGSQQSSVTIDLNGLSVLLDKTAPSTPGAKGASPTPTASKPPVFEISIDDGTGSPTGKASISFSVSFVISAAKNPKTSVQTSANRVAQSAQNGSKIKWSDVVSTGLGIIAKVL